MIPVYDDSTFSMITYTVQPHSHFVAWFHTVSYRREKSLETRVYQYSNVINNHFRGATTGTTGGATVTDGSLGFDASAKRIFIPASIPLSNDPVITQISTR